MPAAAADARAYRSAGQLCTTITNERRLHFLFGLFSADGYIVLGWDDLKQRSYVR